MENIDQVVKVEEYHTSLLLHLLFPRHNFPLELTDFLSKDADCFHSWRIEWDMDWPVSYWLLLTSCKVMRWFDLSLDYFRANATNEKTYQRCSVKEKDWKSLWNEVWKEDQVWSVYCDYNHCYWFLNLFNCGNCDVAYVCITIWTWWFKVGSNIGVQHRCLFFDFVLAYVGA